MAFVAAADHWRANDLYVASPDSPRPRRLLTAQRIEALRLAGRRLLVVVATSKHPDDYVASHTRVVLADLRGRTRTLARYGPGVHVGSDPDFDGQRAAWSVTRTSRDGRTVRPTGAIHVVRVVP
ncbi:MAG: hypothetical protein M3141_01105 [Actinomycetota bacterium]|nr:hypothetical protein [Actinomycetota bacterium]